MFSYLFRTLWWLWWQEEGGFGGAIVDNFHLDRSASNEERKTGDALMNHILASLPHSRTTF